MLPLVKTGSGLNFFNMIRLCVLSALGGEISGSTSDHRGLSSLLTALLFIQNQICNKSIQREISVFYQKGVMSFGVFVRSTPPAEYSRGGLRTKSEALYAQDYSFLSRQKQRATARTTYFTNHKPRPGQGNIPAIPKQPRPNRRYLSRSHHSGRPGQAQHKCWHLLQN